jgi:hypothetical protein
MHGFRAGKDGTPADLGPDHYARLTAVGRLRCSPPGGRCPWPVELKKGNGTMKLAELEARIGENVGVREGPTARAG